MPSESAPPGNRSRTANAARTQSSTDGRNDGTAASRSSASSSVAASAMPPGRRPGWRPPSLPARRRWPPRAPPEQPAQPGSVPVARRAALERVPAHHADQPAAGHPVGERLVDRVVVQGLGHRGVAVVGGLRPGVRAGVEALGVRRGVVEVLGPVEVVEVEVDGGARQVGHDDRAAGLGTRGVSRREPAAEEQRARHAKVAQLGRSGAQVDRRGPASRAASSPRPPAGGRSRPACRPGRRGLGCASRGEPTGAPGRLARCEASEHHPITPGRHSPDGLTTGRKVHAHDPAAGHPGGQVRRSDVEAHQTSPGATWDGHVSGRGYVAPGRRARSWHWCRRRPLPVRRRAPSARRTAPARRRPGRAP